MNQLSIVKKVSKAFETGDFSEVKNNFTKDFIMDWPGMFSVEGINDLELFLQKNTPKRVVEVNPIHLIEKDNLVIGNGTITVEMHSGLHIKNYFCDIYEFEDVKIKKITSYITHDK